MCLVRYFKPTTAMRDAAVTIADRRALMIRVVRDAVLVVVEVVQFGEQTRSVRSMMLRSENFGARVAEERGVANEVCDARDEVRELQDEGAAISNPWSAPQPSPRASMLRALLCARRVSIVTLKGKQIHQLPDTTGTRNSRRLDDRDTASRSRLMYTR